MIELKDIITTGLGVVKSKLGYKIPLKITQYLTYKCNLKCGFCGRRLNKSEEMTTSEIKKSIREFRKLGTKFWSFNGGEPLLKKDIRQLIEYVKKQGMKCSIVTNSWLLPEKIKEIKNIDMVIISMDGPEEIHDKERGKGSYKRVIESLELLKKNNVRVMINTVITKYNIEYLENILNIVDKYDCEWELQPVSCHRADEEKNASEFFPEKSEMKKAVNWIKKKKKKGFKIANSNEYLDQMTNPISEKPACWAGRVTFVISPDGKVLPCAEFLAESNRFKSFLVSGARKAIDQIPNMKDCRDCSFSCYMEYNIALDSLPKTSFKLAKNIIKKRWFWQ